MARCHCRSRAYFAAVRDRQVADRMVHWKQRHCLDIRSGGLADRAFAMGVLFGTDLFAWGRIHQGFCQPAWQQTRQAGRGRACVGGCSARGGSRRLVGGACYLRTTGPVSSCAMGERNHSMAGNQSHLADLSRGLWGALPMPKKRNAARKVAVPKCAVCADAMKLKRVI